MSQKTVDEIIASLPRSEQVIVKRLRTLVFECLPKAEEKSYYDDLLRARQRRNDFIHRFLRHDLFFHLK